MQKILDVCDFTYLIFKKIGLDINGRVKYTVISILKLVWKIFKKNLQLITYFRQFRSNYAAVYTGEIHRQQANSLFYVVVSNNLADYECHTVLSYIYDKQNKQCLTNSVTNTLSYFRG